MRSLIVAVMVAALVALAGCGSSGPSLSAFKSGFQTEKAQFQQLGRDLQSALGAAKGQTDVQLASEFTGLAGRASQQAASLRTLNPPSKYKSQRDQLAADFDTVAADLRAIAAAATGHNGPAARSATLKLVSDAGSLKSVDSSLSSSLGLPQAS